MESQQAAVFYGWVTLYIFHKTTWWWNHIAESSLMWSRNFSRTNRSPYQSSFSHTPHRRGEAVYFWMSLEPCSVTSTEPSFSGSLPTSVWPYLEHWKLSGTTSCLIVENLEIDHTMYFHLLLPGWWACPSEYPGTHYQGAGGIIRLLQKCSSLSSPSQLHGEPTNFCCQFGCQVQNSTSVSVWLIDTATFPPSRGDTACQSPMGSHTDTHSKKVWLLTL